MQEWPAFSVERRAVASLAPYPQNARTHTPAQVAQVAASIRQWGWTVPVLIDEAGVILAGHARVAAATSLAIIDIPVIVATGWSDAQKRAYVLADNQLALNAGWDEELLRVEISGLGDDGFDVGLIGFGDDFLAELFADRNAGLTDPDDAPPLPDLPVSRPGDVWICGAHRILCGDATNADAVAGLLAGARPNLMVTDPPYGVEYDAAWRARQGLNAVNGPAHGKVSNDDRADWREAWSLFPGNVAYVWHGALHNVAVAASLEAAGLKPRAQVIWVKTRPVISRGHYHWQHEPVFYAERDDEPEGFALEHDEAAYVVRAGKTAAWRGGRKQSSVWFIEHIRSETGHSTQKPVDCMRRPIVNNSLPGTAVYDPFCGSGTTIIAAEMEGRQAICLEISPAYVDVAVARWQAFTGLDATLDATGATFNATMGTRHEPQETVAAAE